MPSLQLPLLVFTLFVDSSTSSVTLAKKSEIFPSSSSSADNNLHYINFQWTSFWSAFPSSEHRLLYGLVLLSSFRQSCCFGRHLPLPTIPRLVSFMAQNDLLPPPTFNSSEDDQRREIIDQMEAHLSTVEHRFSRYLRHIAYPKSGLQFYHLPLGAAISLPLKRILAFEDGVETTTTAYGDVFERTATSLFKFSNRKWVEEEAMPSACGSTATAIESNGPQRRRAEVLATVLPRLKELVSYVLTVGGKSSFSVFIILKIWFSWEFD